MRNRIAEKRAEAQRHRTGGNATTRIRIQVSALLFALALVSDAMAHSPAPDHTCAAPQRPLNDQNDARWEAYLAAVDDYRACINGFAQSNRVASTQHNAAANAAIGQWNAFVADQLNVPEDFPWPPVGRPTVAPAVR